ncbi:Hypothetical protein, putative [Bodo saltans]|uniref:Uncharacterized protein n=1 Tax=Bodo saltans TaxID=75058 RepID=A0A0S4IRQ3_BODSA|nr:Hypothetical protein, putative [Bodo saltans]|eukprot:CUG03183.1 Hypothetical protein, putative [Bodo saltans]
MRHGRPRRHVLPPDDWHGAQERRKQRERLLRPRRAICCGDYHSIALWEHSAHRVSLFVAGRNHCGQLTPWAAYSIASQFTAVDPTYRIPLIHSAVAHRYITIVVDAQGSAWIFGSTAKPPFISQLDGATLLYEKDRLKPSAGTPTKAKHNRGDCSSTAPSAECTSPLLLKRNANVHALVFSFHLLDYIVCSSFP